MSHKKHGFRVLGVSLLAVFGLMAFMAAGAQATKGAEWKVLGKTLAGTEEVAAALHSTHVVLLVPGFVLEILCTEISAVDILIFGEGSSTGKLAFNKCITFQNGARAAKCDPSNQPIVAGGKALLILHNSKTYVLFEPTTGGAEGTFATIKFGGECSLAPSKNVTGTLVAECGHLNGSGVFVELDCANQEPSHLLREALAGLFPSDGIFFGAKAATVDGIASVSLNGADKGQNWGGIG